VSADRVKCLGNDPARRPDRLDLALRPDLDHAAISSSPMRPSALPGGLTEA
jgi:hypothetical protein